MQSIDEIFQEPVSEKAQKKKEKQEREIQRLLDNLASATVNKLRDKVAWILNHYPNTRNSDRTLALKFWEEFESDKYSGAYITPAEFYALTPSPSIIRERARIQNTYNLFLPSQRVGRFRKALSEVEKNKSVKDKPDDGTPSVIIYMDESGKNENYLIVGSLWFLHPDKSIYDIHKKITNYKKEINFTKEFHFSEMTQKDLPVYKTMIEMFLKDVPSVSFKVTSLPASGIQNKQNALGQMFYHLVIQGVAQENETGRAVLPRSLQIWKDAEDEGSDSLLIVDLDDKLKQVSASRFNNKLNVSLIRCSDSKHNLFLQIADLLSASANRVLNQPNVARNHKTEFAEYFLDLIGVDKSFSPNDKIDDMVAHISL